MADNPDKGWNPSKALLCVCVFISSSVFTCLYMSLQSLQFLSSSLYYHGQAWTSKNAQDDIKRRARRWHFAHSLLSILLPAFPAPEGVISWKHHMVSPAVTSGTWNCMPRVKAAQSCFLAASSLSAKLSTKRQSKQSRPSSCGLGGGKRFQNSKRSNIEGWYIRYIRS